MKVSTAARELLDLTFQLAKSKETCQSLASDIERLNCEKSSIQSGQNYNRRSGEFLHLDLSISQLRDERKALQRRQDEQSVVLDSLTKKIRALKLGNTQTTEKINEIQATSESLSAAAHDEQLKKKGLLHSIDCRKQQIQEKVNAAEQVAVEIRRSKVRRDRVKERHDQLKARHEKWEQERQHRQQKLDKLLEQVQSASQKITDAKKRRRESSHLLQTRQLELNRLHVQLIRLQLGRKSKLNDFGTLETKALTSN